MPIREIFQEIRPIKEPIGLLLLDVDRPMVYRDKVDLRMLNFVVQLALRGIFVHCITGRSGQEIKEIVFPSLKKITSGLDSKKLQALSWRLTFAGELGSVEIRPNGSFTINLPTSEGHPLTRTEVRESLTSLMWDSRKLGIWIGGKSTPPSGSRVIRGTNGKSYLVPIDPMSQPLLPQFIASKTKIINFTAEVVRDKEGSIPSINMKESDGPVDIIKAQLRKLGIADQVDITSTRTTIDLVPKGAGKAQAAGKAVQRVKETLDRIGVNISLRQICRRTLAIGGGYQSFFMSTPRIGRKKIGKVNFAFVGPKSQLNESRERNVCFVPPSDEYPGTEIAFSILSHLEGRRLFKPFMSW